MSNFRIEISEVAGLHQFNWTLFDDDANAEVGRGVSQSRDAAEDTARRQAAETVRIASEGATVIRFELP